jgi:hypothetical protein
MDPVLEDISRKLDQVVSDVSAIRAREDIVRPEVYRRLDGVETRVQELELQAVLLSRMANDVHEISKVVRSLELWRAWLLGGAAVLGLLGGAMWQIIGGLL